MLVAAWMAVAIVVTFRWALDQGYPEVEARTLALMLFVTLNFWLVLSARAEHRSLFALNPLGNRLLLASALGALLLYMGATQWAATDALLGLVALPPGEWLACLLLGASVLVITEIHKLGQWLTRTRPSGPAPLV